MSNHKKYTRLTEQQYNGIKSMQDSYTPTDVATITGRSYSTVWNIFRSESFQDYKDIVNSARGVHEPKQLELPFENQDSFNDSDPVDKVAEELIADEEADVEDKFQADFEAAIARFHAAEAEHSETTELLRREVVAMESIAESLDKLTGALS